MSPYPKWDYNDKECGGGGGDICLMSKISFNILYVFFRKKAEQFVEKLTLQKSLQC